MRYGDSAVRGRGTAKNPRNRFEVLSLEPDPDVLDDEAPSPRTVFLDDRSRTIVTRNDSPDIPFDRSVNPYRGCEHGCIYCYARPYHEYAGFSAGLDFESRILVKREAPALLRKELAKPSWEPQVVNLSGVTDCYQPIERTLRLTRGCLEVLAEFRNPVGLITKSALVTRDLDLFRRLAAHDAVLVGVSLTTLDAELASKLEPRAARPARRLEAIAEIAAAGVPVHVSVAPVIPGLNEHEIPRIVAAARDAGATSASYLAVRLPYGVKDLFSQWLEDHFPDRKEKVLNRIRSLRGGKLSDARFGHRMRGEGIHADAMEQLFRVACARAGLERDRRPLSTDAFRVPGPRQAGLFDA